MTEKYFSMKDNLKKILIFIFLVTLVGCHFSSDRRINERKPPVTIIAINPEKNSVLLRDGDNKVFTIYNTTTTDAISKSLTVGDTVRIEDNKIVKGSW